MSTGPPARTCAEAPRVTVMALPRGDLREDLTVLYVCSMMATVHSAQ